MKPLFYFTCLFFMLMTLGTSAQLKKIHSDPALAEKFKVEAAKNTGYISLRNQLTSLIKTATPRNTNAAAVRALLMKNADLLKGLYTANGIETPMAKRIKSQPAKKVFFASQLLPGLGSMAKPKNPLLKIFTPPYSGKRDDGQNNSMDPDTALSNFNTGKIAITYTSDDWGEPMNIGLYYNLFKQQVVVPSDPTIVAAEMKLEFSYQYTGWDTYGSVRGLSTMFRTDGLMDQNQATMPQFEFQGGAVFPPYRIPAVLQPMDSIMTDFDDFLVSGSDSLVVQRYLTPGGNFTIEFGLLFPYSTKRGTNGCYHYAEMILKKITIRYLKADGN